MGEAKSAGLSFGGKSHLEAPTLGSDFSQQRGTVNEGLGACVGKGL